MNHTTTDSTNWKPDPYGIHEFRFFSSDGKPTQLVMDGGKRSYDKPPAIDLSLNLKHPAPPTDSPSSEPDRSANLEPGPSTAHASQSGAAPSELERVAEDPIEQIAVRVSGRPSDNQPAQSEVRRAPPVRVIHSIPVVEHREAEPISQGLKIVYAVVLSVLVVSVLGFLYVHLHHTTANHSQARSSGATTTTVSAHQTTTTLAVPAAPKPSAEAAAAALVSSWSTGNRSEALTVATSAAVATLFATPYSSATAIDRGCSTAFTPIVCTFGPPGGASPTDPIYQILVSQVSGGWYVSSVRIER